MSRARWSVREWAVPCGTGLAAAALIIAGLETGGWVARATLVAAWVALGAIVVWGIRASLAVDRELASWEDLPDDPSEGGGDI